MNLVWRETGWEQYLFWQQTDKKILKKINELIKEIKRSHLTASANPNR